MSLLKTPLECLTRATAPYALPGATPVLIQQASLIFDTIALH